MGSVCVTHFSMMFERLGGFPHPDELKAAELATGRGFAWNRAETLARAAGYRNRTTPKKPGETFISARAWSHRTDQWPACSDSRTSYALSLRRISAVVLGGLRRPHIIPGRGSSARVDDRHRRARPRPSPGTPRGREGFLPMLQRQAELRGAGRSWFMGGSVLTKATRSRSLR